MLSLIIDTAVDKCQVAVMNGDDICVVQSVHMIHGFADALMPMIDNVLMQAHKELKDIKRIIVTVGPGSFTGIRVGLSAARAFGASLAIPVLGISTLKNLAFQAHNPHSILSCVDTRRGDYYTQEFYALGTVNEPKIMTPAEIEKFEGPVIGVDQSLDINACFEMADAGLIEESLTPIYVRPADAKRAAGLPSIDW